MNGLKKMIIMKFSKILFSISLASIMFGSISSCSDSFLDEDLTTSFNTDRFKSQIGLDELTTGAYQKLKFKFNYEWAIRSYNLGVDEFTDGNNIVNSWNHYGQDLNSSEDVAIAPIWDNYYGLIEPANIIISFVPQYYDKTSNTYNTRLGEGYFLRAFAYFELVKQFGGVPLKLQPSTSVETYFTRDSEEAVYAQIIADLEEAYKLLPVTGEGSGRIRKSAAAHFLAKAHLFRASELYSGWNSEYVESDLDAVIVYGEEVLAAHPLTDNYAELWDFKEPNGANENVSEIILAAQFSNDESTWGRYGNQVHLYYPSIYQTLPGTSRDISGGREFSYASATEYTMEVFDRVNDSRFWKSFITTYGANNTKGAPEWRDFEVESGLAPAGAVIGGKRFVAGELGIKYIVNNPGDTRYMDGDSSNVLKDGIISNTHTFVRYFKDEQQSWNLTKSDFTGNYYQFSPHKHSVALSKFRDGYRNSIASQFGVRDGIIARSAEDVLMVAEAYIRKGEAHYDKAIEWMNKLRDRAGYADGEDRSVHIDGGQAYKTNPYAAGKGGGFSADGAIYFDTNTYYESNNLEVSKPTASTKSNLFLNSVEDVYNSSADILIYDELGYSSNAEKMMCFLLNERTRELCGELYRWEDLARTKTLNARWNKFNDASERGIGNFDSSKHYYRPIPQSFLDGITNSGGRALSPEEKQAMQNPGY